MSRRSLLLVTVLGVVLGLAVMPASGVDLAGPDGVPDPPVSMARALTAQADATSDLLEKDGIIGTGVGVGPDDEPHVVVLLETPQDAAVVPSSIDGVETETLVTGTLQTFPCPGGATSDCSAPIPGGVSVGHPSITAGTLGAYVQNAQGYYALSNNHVFAAENTASVGDVVLQPGPADGGSASNPSHILGTLAAFEPIVRCDPIGGCGASPTNLIDAAIVAVESDTVQAENICGWTPQATTLPVSAIDIDATELKKCGRTTGETTGTVTVVNATVDVQGTLGVARFTGQLITGPMAAGGDSGSLMVDLQNRPAALLFAGSDTATIGTPIDNVLDRFGVTIVDTDPADPPPSNLVPVASFTVSCTGLTCSLDGSGSSDPDGSITSYVWDFGDGGTGSGATTAHAYASAGAKTVTLTVTDNDGATDTETGTADPVDPPPSNLVPVASFTVSCTGLTCSLDGSGSSDPDGSITSYVWDFGDGGTGSGATTAHAYASAGARTVTLTVTDDDGATDTETGTASPVDPPPSNLVPVASFTVSCAELTCRFDGSGSLDPDGSIMSYVWSFGDGGTGTARVADHAYASGGDRIVTLMVTDNRGATGTDNRVIDPANPPPPDQPPPVPTAPRASVGLVDPARGLWSLPDPGGIESQALVDSGRLFYFGNPGDTPIVGDWDCDGDETPGMYRRSDGFVYLRNSNTQGIANIRFFFGNPSDVPLAGDFNGDGCHTVSIYRPSEQRFYLIDDLGEGDGGLGAASSSFLFGNSGDTPVVGDWDGDGIDEVGLYRESTGLFYWRNTLTTGVADGEIFFGDPGDRFVAGDWGLVDGRDTPAVFRPANQVLYFRFTLDQGVADAEVPTEAGPSGLPVAGTFGLD